MNFALKEKKAYLSHLNLRAEQHGTEPVAALDLSLSIEVHNEELSLFHSSLKAFLYQKPVRGDAQLALGGDELTELRYERLTMPLSWEGEIIGGTCTVHHGINQKSDMVLTECKIGGFKIDCKEGGTVNIMFKVSTNPDEKHIGLLAGKIKSDVVISITPPSAETEQTV